MKPHERRKAVAYPAYRLAKWSEISITFMEAPRLHPSIDAAKRAAKQRGKYQLTEVRADGQEVIETFTV